ncbi:MAG: polysaccharide pyruvyl transferase family protein [Candidatus Shapirobacteria bacterium]|jgi:colanic acid/amylovoran biosynthesis protein
MLYNHKNIIISHVYSKDNKGDAALLSVLIDDIKREFKNPSITILTLDSIIANEKFDGINVKNSFMFYAMKSFHNNFSTLLYSVYIMSITTLWAYIYKYTKFSLPINHKLKDICLLYSQADLILPVGGGYIRSQKKGVGSLLNIILLLHPIKISSIFKKPTILYTQSVGPFSSKLEEKIVSHTLNNYVDATILREDTSLKLLKKIGVNKNIYRSIDSGFAFKNKNTSYDLRKLLNIKKDKLIVGITARKWLSITAQNKYELELAKTIRYIVEKYNIAVVLIPQVTAEFHKDDDRIVHNRIRRNIGRSHDIYVINEKLNHHQIKAIYDSLDFVIGTRFHSVIFSLTSYVPAIAIEYEHKTGGIMHDLKLDNWVIKIEEVESDKLCQKFDQLVIDSKKYKDHLKTIMPVYIKKADESIKIVRKHYDAFVKKQNSN